MPDRRASLAIRAHPRAARDRVGPMVDGVLQVHVSKAPHGGEANEAIRRVLAGAIGVAPSRLTLAAGGRGRQKRFAIDGMSGEELAARLRRLEGAD